MRFQPSENQIVTTEKWLKLVLDKKYDFSFDEEAEKFFEKRKSEIEPDFNDLYKLLAHDLNVIEYNDYPQNKRMRISQVGIEIIEHNGYKNWRKWKDAQLQYIKDAPELQRQLTESTKRSQHTSNWIGFCALIALIVQVSIDGFQCNTALDKKSTISNKQPAKEKTTQIQEREIKNHHHKVCETDSLFLPIKPSK